MKEKYFDAYASIRIYGGSIAPAEVTKLLKIPPDKMIYKGEPNLTRTKKVK